MFPLMCGETRQQRQATRPGHDRTLPGRPQYLVAPRASHEEIFSNFSREASPRTSSIEDFGTPNAFATAAITALLALPLSGGAVTHTRTALPSTAIRAAEAFGVTLTASIPSADTAAFSASVA